MNGFTSNNKAVPLYCIFHNHNHINVATGGQGDCNPPVKDWDTLIEQSVTRINESHRIIIKQVVHDEFMKQIRTVRHSFNTTGTANYRVQLAVPPSIKNNYNNHNHNTVRKKTLAVKTFGESIVIRQSFFCKNLIAHSILQSTVLKAKCISGNISSMSFTGTDYFAWSYWMPHLHIDCIRVPLKGVFISKIVMCSCFALGFILVSALIACILIMPCLHLVDCFAFWDKKLKFFLLILSICQRFFRQSAASSICQSFFANSAIRSIR